MQSTSRQNKQSKKPVSILSLAVSFILVATTIFIFANVQAITDYVNYTLYEPTTQIEKIAQGAKMSKDGKYMFYVTQPAIDGTRAFDAVCDRREQNIAILGCYANNRIYIFDVSDERLDGIEEVTAVHELLHAIYQRLPDGEREQIDNMLDEEAKKLEKDSAFMERMDFYARTEPGERYNELHSIIGTEVKDIDSRLERHYAKYFDRETILDLFANYKNEFKQLENQAKSLKLQIEELAESIQRAKDDYAIEVKSLDRDINDFNSRADGGNFKSQQEFDAERQTLVDRTAELRNDRSAINSMVNRYNKLIEQHNEIITESNKLYQSIDSSLAPAPSV